MKGNTDKSHLLLSKSVKSSIGSSWFFNQKYHLWETSGRSDWKQTKFSYEHSKISCKKANSILRALARAATYMYIGNWKLLLNVFFNASVR